MTRKEKKIIQSAIEDIHSEDGSYERGIGNLCKLVGWCYPASEIDSSTRVTLSEIANRKPDLELTNDSDTRNI